jgi:hypothetical protein
MTTTFGFGIREGSGRLTGTASAKPDFCLFQILYDATQAALEARVDAEAGMRVIVVVIGDGVIAPMDLRVLVTRRDVLTTLPTIDARINGLYYAPSRPGLVVQLALDARAFNGVRALIGGVTPTGESWWGLGTGSEFLQYLAGSPDGAPPALPVRDGSASVSVFACDHAVLRLSARSLLESTASGTPVDIELRKLLPQGDCNGQER